MNFTGSVESQDLFEGLEDKLSGRDCPSPTFDIEAATEATPDLIEPTAYATGLFEDEYDSDGSEDLSGREAPMPVFDLQDDKVVADSDANIEVSLQDPAEYTSVSPGPSQSVHVLSGLSLSLSLPPRLTLSVSSLRSHTHTPV